MSEALFLQQLCALAAGHANDLETLLRVRRGGRAGRLSPICRPAVAVPIELRDPEEYN